MSRQLTLFLLSLSVAINAHAGSLCSIERVENVKEGIRVIFVKDFNPNILGIKRVGSEKLEKLNPGSPLMLKEGEESAVRESPHDFCTLKAEKKDGKLGISVTANNHIPGIPQTNRSEFILPK